MWTKRQLIVQAFAELALAGYEWDITPEEEQAALQRLDTMMATWLAEGLVLGYAMSLTADGSSLDDDSGLPLVAVEAAYMGLSQRIAAGKGKALPTSSKATAKAAKDAVVSWLAAGSMPTQQLAAGMPVGAGSRGWRRNNRPFVSTPDKGPLRQDGDGGIDFVN